MIIASANFSDGFRAVGTRLQHRTATHAWRATGHLVSGKAWALWGFSASAEKAKARLRELTRHLPRQGAATDLEEIVTVQAKRGRKPASSRPVTAALRESV